MLEIIRDIDVQKSKYLGRSVGVIMTRRVA